MAGPKRWTEEDKDERDDEEKSTEGLKEEGWRWLGEKKSRKRIAEMVDAMMIDRTLLLSVLTAPLGSLDNERVEGRYCRLVNLPMMMMMMKKKKEYVSNKK